MTSTPTARCPRCGSSDTVAIVYGLPGGELMEASQRGEVVIGGCLVHAHQPTRSCTACHHAFIGPPEDDEDDEDEQYED